MVAIERHKDSKGVKMPDTVPASAGGFNKTNWDLEIRKRYLAPLATETFEFPDPDSILARMVPTCYECSLTNGCAPSCADLLSSATEQFVKEVMSNVMLKTRSNIAGSRSGDGVGIITSRFRKLLGREEEAAEKGEVARSEGVGLLPCELEERKFRKGIGIGDLRFAEEIGGVGIGSMLPLVRGVMEDYQEGVLERWIEDPETTDDSIQHLSLPLNGAEDHQTQQQAIPPSSSLTNGRTATTPISLTTPINRTFPDQAADDEMEDSTSLGWDGVAATDRAGLDSMLDDCLALA